MYALRLPGVFFKVLIFSRPSRIEEFAIFKPTLPCIWRCRTMRDQQIDPDIALQWTPAMQLRKVLAGINTYRPPALALALAPTK